ncbi:MAG: hypothetical protein ACKOA6_03395 [Actinomycetota bacterium]
MQSGYQSAGNTRHRLLVCQGGNVLECVVNVSEGRRNDVLAGLAEGVEPGHLLDVHVDRWHNRSVFTLVGTEAPRQLTRRAVECLDLDGHHGAHPRLGVVDVVPFVPLDTATMDEAVAARDDFATWLAEELAVPSFLYGPTGYAPGRSLPDIRRRAWQDLSPDVGPHRPHPTAGAVCVGARGPLVAYNIWLREGDDWTIAAEITSAIRSSHVRALTLRLGDRVQISMNLIDPAVVGPAEVYDRIGDLCASRQLSIARAELVGLVPAAVLDRIPSDRWSALDLDPRRTIEDRLSKGYTFSGPT